MRVYYFISSFSPSNEWNMLPEILPGKIFVFFKLRARVLVEHVSPISRV
jgi:hypothetical protein